MWLGARRFACRRIADDICGNILLSIIKRGHIHASKVGLHKTVTETQKQLGTATVTSVQVWPHNKSDLL